MKKIMSWITDIEKGENGHAKGIENIFNKIIAENSPSLKEEAHPGSRGI